MDNNGVKNCVADCGAVFVISDDMGDGDDDDVVDIFVNKVDMGDVGDAVDGVSAIVVAVGDSDKRVVVVVAAAFVDNIDDIAVVLPVPSNPLVETSVQILVKNCYIQT